MSIGKSKKMLLVAGSVVIMGWCGYLVGERIHHAAALRRTAREAAIPDVMVISPRPEARHVSLELPGTVEAWYQAPIYPQASGYVRMWYKDYGARVAAGDVLAEINTPGLDAQFAQAQADLQSSQAKYDLAVVTAQRWRLMGRSQAVSGQSVSVQDANEKSAAADLEAARHNLDRYAALERFKVIVAPFSGVVTERDINVGDYVHEGGGNLNANGGASELFSVADTHQMRLFVSIPENMSYILQPGLQASVRVPQFPDRVFEGKFLTVSGGYDPDTRTSVSEFVIDNKDNALWPGTFAAVTLSAPEQSGHLSIPTGALVFQEHGMQVAVVDSHDTAHFRDITVGRMGDGATQVLSGVSTGDRIIDNPPADLLEGEKVHVVPPAAGYSNDVSEKDDE
ncbi:efflux RND transporter periplasmic adaptor subunit [Gluconacetobacter entanii]|uniref:Efflux RND transporter periplasmic adaptor subunit n=1 Tax=Gluconacetobacter entanii TaxID=108528 RepID=A0ABT3K9T3_9PROT|nr:efflux RND transporter periplasmic adaptor subunit [Gluconacetobacter entanii]MCE2577783.1 efflux RND transporter periplasmic adaptor subunit [Komagataeibacter sp. FNDCR1]MBY4638855.1 efflux RND transporter periplasmic adaptor subunit [Gluconacetobacter entanii]MCW4580838.1 efflux RND transporter periplasmic adaptor subunit [Gluconacetobacter entanii]MCW4584167.1 efflux RND transporter periplasmic adaptor subunit [Gluconacetobacter entanii]MCW4587511.1 efflux RND transporter periplasmic ada